MGILDTILGIVFPAKCVACGVSLEYLCLSCLENSPEAERECAPWIFPLYDYRHPPLKKALWLLKYKGKKRLAYTFAENMYGRILEELSDLKVMENWGEVILIPVPLSGKRYRERGFNQAELICNALENLDKSQNLKLEKNILVKPSDTKHQAHILNRSERLKNIIGSFEIRNPQKLFGKNIILIDDIITTGATLGEAKKMLMAAGARSVVAFTVAH